MKYYLSPFEDYQNILLQITNFHLTKLLLNVDDFWGLFPNTQPHDVSVSAIFERKDNNQLMAICVMNRSQMWQNVLKSDKVPCPYQTTNHLAPT